MTNPLLGANGATEIYGPQKGADAKMIPKLIPHSTTYHDMIERELNVSVKDIPGAGAAGGLGACVMRLSNALILY